MFYVFCALIGLAAGGLILLIYIKIKNKLLACALSCMIGIILAVGITICAINMLPVAVAGGSFSGVTKL